MEGMESSNTKIILIIVLLSVFAGAYWYSQQVAPVENPVENLVENAVKSMKNIVSESFQNVEPSVPDGVTEDVIGSNVTYPTEKNPFMNVLNDEIKYNPTRAPAASVLDPSVNATLDDFFRTQFINDPTDVFGKTQSQREFYTMPSTTVPNDQASYQDWLYKIPGKTCKEGGPCLSGTDGGVYTHLNENP